MEKTLEKGQDKIQQICNLLRRETLEPAEKEALSIVEQAKEQADKLIEEAKKKAALIENEAMQKIEQERTVFRSSLQQAVKQSKEALKQQIEDQLFSNALPTLAHKQLIDPQVISRMVTALVEAIEKEGISANFSAIIPKEVAVEAVNQLLAKQIIEKLHEKSVIIGDIKGGTQLKLHDKSMICDMSDKAIGELLSQYIRKDFRNILFKE